MDPKTFENLWPDRYVSFSFPNPKPNSLLYADPLRVAVLDSPDISLRPSPHVVAMLVPLGRESDWIFSTEPGHHQLLVSSPVLPTSRLILVGDFPPDGSSPAPYTRSGSVSDNDLLNQFQNALVSLVLALCPEGTFEQMHQCGVPFVCFEDDLLRSVPLEIITGPVVGEMLVEDVEIDDEGSLAPQLFRRLRFKNSPLLEQSKVRLLPTEPLSTDSVSHRPEMGSLMLPYLAPMVAGLSLISPLIEELARVGSRPRALCIGVGGGALLVLLESRLDFDVLGVEADPVVLDVAKRHFGLVEGDFLRVRIGDGIGFIRHFVRDDGSSRKLGSGGGRGDVGAMEILGDRLGGFDVIMVDINAGDARSGLSAPPMEFVHSSVLLAARSALHKHGMLVANVLLHGMSFYKPLIDSFREAFAEVYEIDVENGENVVVLATKLTVGSIPSESKGPWIDKLYQVIGPGFVDRIKKVEV